MLEKCEKLLEDNNSVVELYRAGYIKEDGSIIYVEEYHGENDDLRDMEYVEFSNTHPEEDTCIRVYKEPTQEQYKLMEQIFNLYLDNFGYSKVEVWKNVREYTYYKVFSLYEDACQDWSFEEEIGNWTGYDLVQKIRNQYNNLKESLTLNEATRNQILSKSKKGDDYSKGGNRWTRKSRCSVANTVKDYNKIDMDTFWKHDILNFGVKVHGETAIYTVTIEFNNILRNLQNKIKQNKNKLDQKVVYDALMTSINNNEIKFSCDCADFKYRMAYYASKNGYKAGEKETRASDKTNPNDTKGAACKHVLAALNNAEWLNKIASVINNYINYCKDNMEYNYSKYIFPNVYGMPYQKAVQMCLTDYKDDGEIDDKLKSDEATINLSNALGKVRGRIKKGSNKNPVSQKDSNK